MRRWLAASATALCLLGGLTACSGDSGPSSVLRSFLSGWPQAKVDGVGLVDAAGTPIAAAVVSSQMKSLAGDLDLGKIKAVPAGDPAVHGTDATAPVNVDWPVGPVVWHYQTTVRLQGGQDTWRVVWSPATLHPQLRAGDALSLNTTPAPRGQVLDGSGHPIVTNHDVVDVGIEPKLVKDQAALLSALAKAFTSVGVDVSLADLPAQIAAAKPDAFVPVVTLRVEAYDAISAQIHDLDGTVFQRRTQQLAPTRDFARALLGTVGPVRRDQMDAHPGTYEVGDLVGQGGLEEQYDALLRGTRGVKVVISGRGTQDHPEADVQLFSADPKPGTDLQVTLDTALQTAADAALSTSPTNASLIAVRISDGHLLVVSNGPHGGTVDLALTGAVPPGSTFKTVTALAALDSGLANADSTVNCPKQFTVEGRTFTNDNGFELGPVPLHTDFAKSCNTAFASLGTQLPADALTTTAAALGIDTSWNLGTDVYTGSVPVPTAKVDAAAAGFGQGQTQVSPVAMAAAAAAVARGSWRQPVLFPALPKGAPAASPGPTTAAGSALNATSVAALQQMMREVVTGGTATPLAAVPGGPVMAKTGTAEFDNNPAHTHSWVIGWQGDIAFAVFVENGGESSARAVPLAKAFLTAVNQAR